MTKLINLKIFSRFFHSSTAGGVILLICVAISLLIANSGWSDDFQSVLNIEFGFNSDAVHLRYPILLWIR